MYLKYYLKCMYFKILPLTEATGLGFISRSDVRIVIIVSSE